MKRRPKTADDRYPPVKIRAHTPVLPWPHAKLTEASPEGATISRFRRKIFLSNRNTRPASMSTAEKSDEDNTKNQVDEDSEAETTRGCPSVIEPDSRNLSSPELYYDPCSTSVLAPDNRSGDRSIHDLLNPSEDEESRPSTQSLSVGNNRKRKVALVDSEISGKASIASWKSIRSAIGRRVRPVASSTPLALKSRTREAEGAPNSPTDFEDGGKTQVLVASSMGSEEIDSVLYYGAPMPGTSSERRRAMFRNALSIEDGASTPDAERVQEAPKNSIDFVPKSASTAVSGGQLGSPEGSPSMSPIK